MSKKGDLDTANLCYEESTRILEAELKAQTHEKSGDKTQNIVSIKDDTFILALRMF